MASISDTLTTILRLQGLSQYVQGMQSAAQATASMAVQTNNSALAMGAMGFQGNAMLGKLGQVLIISQMVSQAMQQIAAVAKAGMTAFEQYNDTLTRTALIFQNLGNNVPLSSFRNLADQRLFSANMDPNATLNLAGQARRLGFPVGHMNELITTLQDQEASGGPGAERTLNIINQFLRTGGGGRGGRGGGGGGGGRGLSRLGVDARGFTGDPDKDILEILRQIRDRTGGVAEFLRNTPSGAFEQFSKLNAKVLTNLGEVIERSLVPVIEFLNRSLQGIINTQRIVENQSTGALQNEAAVARSLAPGGGLAFSLLANYLQSIADSQKDLDARGEKQNHLLEMIERNTQSVANTIQVAVFGSASNFTRQAGSFMNLNAAIAARV